MLKDPILHSIQMFTRPGSILITIDCDDEGGSGGGNNSGGKGEVVAVADPCMPRI